MTDFLSASFLKQASLFNVDLSQFKKELNYFTSVEENESESINLEEFMELFNELTLIKKDLDDTIKQSETYEEKTLLNGKLFDEKIEQENRSLRNEYEELQKELKQIQESLQNATKANEFKIEYRNQNLKLQTHESQMNIIHNDHKLFNQINKTEQNLISIFQAYDEKTNKSKDTVLTNYFIIEVAIGVKVFKLDEIEQNGENPWFDIVFTYLPDSSLDFEMNFESHPFVSKSKTIKLSDELVDRYRTIFKKRKQKNTKTLSKNCVMIDNISDFKGICSSYIELLCFILGKQEIEEAKKQFALDWIDGSQVLTILINSKSSKMATIVLPKFYPLCGTSLIKLISLTGYEDSQIKNFKIEKNLSCLSEWIAYFTDLYNTNQII